MRESNGFGFTHSGPEQQSDSFLPRPQLLPPRVTDDVDVEQRLNRSQTSTLEAMVELFGRPGRFGPMLLNVGERSGVTGFSSGEVGAERGPDDLLPRLLRECRKSMQVTLQRGLDELDTTTRVRAGYSFIDLPVELQEAVIGLVATRDLASSTVDLGLWLEELHCAICATV